MLPRGFGPHLHPRPESSKGGWDRPGPPMEVLSAREAPASGALGRRSRVGVDEVPSPGRSGRTRGRRSPTSPPQHPQRGTCLHLLGAGTSTSTIAFSGEGERTRRGWLGGGIWSPGPCVPGAGPLGAQAGPRVRPESPAETGSDNVCRPDQGDVVRVQAVRVRARAQGPGLHGGDVIM